MSAAENTTAIDQATGLSAEELELLTPEERAAIADGAEEAAEQEALSRIAANAPDDDDEDDDGGDKDGDKDGDKTAAGDTPTPAIPAEAAPAPAAADLPADTPTPKPQAQPSYTAELPADIEAKQQAISTELGELRDKFKAGDIDVDDYEARRDTLLDQRGELSKAITKAEISQEMQQQSAQAAWQAAIDRTFDAAIKPEQGGIDYRKDQAKAADLDLFVRRLAEDPANADKDMEWFLTEGHRRVKALHGVAVASPAVQPAPTQTRKAPIDAAPKTLAQVPGADGPGDVGGEFADIDALDGYALEDAVARLSPMQRAKYEQGR